MPLNVFSRLQKAVAHFDPLHVNLGKEKPSKQLTQCPLQAPGMRAFDNYRRLDLRTPKTVVSGTLR